MKYSTNKYSYMNKWEYSKYFLERLHTKVVRENQFPRSNQKKRVQLETSKREIDQAVKTFAKSNLAFRKDNEKIYKKMEFSWI